MISWTVAAPAIGAAFVASLVEAVEAFTIVLAVGTLRGWRPALYWLNRRTGGTCVSGCGPWADPQPNAAACFSVRSGRAASALRDGLVA